MGSFASDVGCCLPLCSLFECGIGYNVKNENSSIYTQENCCEANCLSLDCT